MERGISKGCTKGFVHDGRKYCRALAVVQRNEDGLVGPGQPRSVSYPDGHVASAR